MSFKLLNISKDYLEPNCMNCVFNTTKTENVECERRELKFSVDPNKNYYKKMFECFEHKEVVEKIELEKQKEVKHLEQINKKIEQKTGKDIVFFREKQKSIVYWLSDFKNL